MPLPRDGSRAIGAVVLMSRRSGGFAKDEVAVIKLDHHAFRRGNDEAFCVFFCNPTDDGGAIAIIQIAIVNCN